MQQLTWIVDELCYGNLVDVSWQKCSRCMLLGRLGFYAGFLAFSFVA